MPPMTSSPPLPAGSQPWSPRPATAPPGRLQSAANRFWEGRREPVPALVLVGAGGTGLLGAVVLTDRPGLGFALLAAAVWVAAAPALVRGRRWTDLALAAGSVAAVAVVALRDSAWVIGTCLPVALVAALVAATGARSTLAVLAAPLTTAATAVRALPWLARSTGRPSGSSIRQVARIGWAVLVAVVLLVVFGELFATADPVFARLLPHIDLSELPVRIVLGGIAAGTAALVAHLTTTPPPGASFTARRARPARLVEWLVPVGALAVFVWLFVLVQLGGLVGGTRAVLASTGLTYAQYARQGFGQLLTATALTLVVVAVAARRAPRVTPAERVATSATLGLLCVGTLGVVASALRRMDLYVGAFGLTSLRVMATWAELVLGVVLVLVLLAGVRWRATWLPRAVVGTLVVAVLGLAVWNPDAQIVRYDASASETVDLDLAYLGTLSADAVPAAAALSEPARSCLLATLPREEPESWTSWNLSRARAATTTAGAGCVVPTGSTGTMRP